MKKKRYSVLINIATICLCVCAIAVGVYAAKSATLNVTGSVGFTAHDCSVQVTGTVTGATQTVAQYNQASTTGGELQAWEIGNLTFDDTKAILKPIVITFTITNNTPEFGVGVRIVNMPSGNERITVDLQNDATYIAMRGTGTAQSKTITITFTLLDDSTSVTDTISLNNLQLKIDKKTDPGFEYSIATLKDYEVDGSMTTYNSDNPRVVTTNKLVVNMGTYSSKPIRWYAFAVRDDGNLPTGVTYPYEISSGGKTWKSLYKVDMSNFDVAGKTFWFVQEYVTKTSQKFHSSSHVYANSEIKTYLSGTYLTDANLSGDSIYTSKIQERTEGTDAPFTSQKLWLLSQAELGLAYGGIWDYQSYKAITYGISQTPGTGFGAVWWLRSPDPSDSYYAYFVDDDGILSDSYVGVIGGVRSAFQIQM